MASDQFDISTDQCLLFHLKQLITAEDSVVLPFFYKRFRSFNTSCPVSKRFTLAMGLALYLRRSQKSNLVITS